MNWDDFRVFLALARSGTLTGAAGMLGLTQPTVGRRLKAMEARGGVRLLERTPDGFDLTEAGAMLLASAERMEIEAQTAERSVAGRDIRLEGSVRITTIEVLAQTFLVAVVDRVQRTHPGIRIEILPDTRALSLSKREADLAVRVAPFSGSELVTRRLADVGVGIYASRGYLDRRPAPDRPPRRTSPAHWHRRKTCRRAFAFRWRRFRWCSDPGHPDPATCGYAMSLRDRPCCLFSGIHRRSPPGD